jgi:hypothetical protein
MQFANKEHPSVHIGTLELGGDFLFQHSEHNYSIWLSAHGISLRLQSCEMMSYYLQKYGRARSKTRRSEVDNSEVDDFDDYK